MFNWALSFLIVAIIAAVSGLPGIAGIATNIAWILFVGGLIFSLTTAFTGRWPRL